MKTILIVFSLLARGALAAHEPASVHGMLVVGGQKIYLSHLPMFHSPHDYQLILEAELDGQALAAYRASRAASDETVYTIAPERFVLPEMVANPRPFRASLFRGHFERGGKRIAEGTVVIRRVLHFRKLDAQAPQPERMGAFLFGNETERFLAHLITARPDFDQIVQVAVIGPVYADGAAVLPAQPNDRPLERGARVRVELPRLGAVDLNVTTQIYMERGDLES